MDCVGTNNQKEEKMQIMNGHGKRAARREKFLSKPLADGRPPFTFIAINPGAGTFLRRKAHKSNRQALKLELASVDAEEALHEASITSHRPAHLTADTPNVVLPDLRGAWMYQRIRQCLSVHVTRDRIYFNR